MKVLQIDQNFTYEYICDLKNFFRNFLTHSVLFKSHDSSLRNSIVNFSSQVEKLISRYNSQKKNAINFTLSINPNFVVSFDNPLLKHSSEGLEFYLCVGGILKIEEGVLVSQSINLSIILKNSDKISCDRAIQLSCSQFEPGYQVIRKFHFDFDVALDRDKWPKAHFQYGGKDLRQFMPFEESETVNYELFSVLDVPRLPYPPYSLILCFDLFFRSLDSECSKIVEEAFWRKAVIQAEQKWVVPFYDNARNFLSRSDRSHTLFEFFVS